MQRKIIVVAKYPDYDGTQACANLGEDLFYSKDDEPPLSGKNTNYAMYKKMCEGCSFYQPCYDWAIKHERFGFWAGTGEGERILIRKKLKIILDDPTKWIK